MGSQGRVVEAGRRSLSDFPMKRPRRPRDRAPAKFKQHTAGAQRTIAVDQGPEADAFDFAR